MLPKQIKGRVHCNLGPERRRASRNSLLFMVTFFADPDAA